MIRRSCAVAVQAFAMLAFVQVASAQTVDELVAKNIAAKGGEQAIKGVQTVKQSLTMSMGGMEAMMTMFAKRPNQVRQEISIAGQQIVMAFDGTTVWTINPMAGSTAPVPVTGPEGEMLKEQASFDGPLLDYKAQGSTVTFVGAETIDGRPLHHLKVVPKSGLTQDIYLDATTGLEARQVIAGPAGAVVMEFSDYRTVNGLKVPFSIKMSQGGQAMGEMRISNVEFNVPIDDALFKMGGK